ncbi:LOW QUALITY PROTEIN: globoside alpha-1,3-N-acetylgalactosaminyltransferase 1-like [Arvicanthis niloticus]|uniref:LOW QUALITY PROTEIN: globoside alpha-1,3-N-acetylgalactosaminyltransferase 1-like n=1 Tax=Arvicanthis niloticus TaxID=61156 RepID=UPI00402B082D
MTRRRLALGLAFSLLVGTGLWVLWEYVKDWMLVSYIPYYLPGPEFLGLSLASPCLNNSKKENMKLPFRQEKLIQPVTQLQYPQPKLLEHGPTELLTLTPWLAPIISKGTFDPELLKNMYQPLNLTIGVTVFAVEKYTCFTQSFLESAEEFFIRGYQVHYYLFTQDPAAVPRVPLGPGRLLSIIPIRGYSQWEEISKRRMETINKHIAKRAHKEVDYLFCVDDVDMVFRNPWGPETLGDLVAAIHPGYFAVPRQQFPYEHWQVSSAFVADSEVDFYYGGAVFGGRVARVYEFTRACHMGILMDKANSIMAAWQEESHLNCYFIWHKPSKVLSPEYLWDDRKPEDDPILLSGKGYNWLRS